MLFTSRRDIIKPHALQASHARAVFRPTTRPSRAYGLGARSGAAAHSRRRIACSRRQGDGIENGLARSRRGTDHTKECETAAARRGCVIQAQSGRVRGGPATPYRRRRGARRPGPARTRPSNPSRSSERVTPGPAQSRKISSFRACHGEAHSKRLQALWISSSSPCIFLTCSGVRVGPRSHAGRVPVAPDPFAVPESVAPAAARAVGSGSGDVRVAARGNEKEDKGTGRDRKPAVDLTKNRELDFCGSRRAAPVRVPPSPWACWGYLEFKRPLFRSIQAPAHSFHSDARPFIQFKRPPFHSIQTPAPSFH